MRDFIKVSPSIWRSKKFRSLPDDNARLAYLYILTCPHGSSVGCFDLPVMYAAADLGWTQEDFQKAIDSLCEADLIAWDPTESTVMVVNWEEYNQPTNPKHAIGMIGHIDKVSSQRLKLLVFKTYFQLIKRLEFDRDAALRKAIDGLRKAFVEPIPIEIEIEIEMEKERERRGERDRERDLDAQETLREQPRPAAALSGAGLAAAQTRGPALVTTQPSQALLQAAHRIGATPKPKGS